MLTHFTISKQGKSHIASNTSCQDYSASVRISNNSINQEFVISAIADGVGSCMYSEFGAKTAIETTIEYLKQKLEELKESLTDTKAKELLKQAFEQALEKVEQEADEKNLPFLSFDSTLTCAIYDGSNLYFQHIGDDGIVAMFKDGTYRLITRRHKGDEASSVFPLRNQGLWQFGRESDVVSYAMMTDGMLDRFVGSEKMKNRVYYPFLYSALKFNLENDEHALEEKQWWEKYLSAEGNDGRIFADEWDVSDDLTYAVIQNTDLIDAVQVEPFDEEKWNEDTKKRNEEINNALYDDFYNYQKQKKQKEEEAISLVDSLCNMAAESYDLGTKIKQLIKKLIINCEEKQSDDEVTANKNDEEHIEETETKTEGE